LEKSEQPQKNFGRTGARRPAFGRTLLGLLCFAFAAGIFVPDHAVKAAPGFVQGNDVTNFTNSDPPVTFSNSVLAGDVIAVGIDWGISHTLNSITASCVSGNFTLLDNPTVYPSNTNAAQGYAVVATSGPCTVTGHLSGADSGTIAVHEISGVNTVSPLDGHAMQYQNSPFSANAASSGNITTTQGGDYIFGASFDAGGGNIVYAVGTGYTKRISDLSHVTTEDGIQPAAGAIAATFTVISPAFGHTLTGIMAFRALSGIQASNRSDILSDSRPSATSNHTIAFTINNSIVGSSVSGSSILSLALDPNFTIGSGMTCGDVDVATGSQFNFNYPGCQATATAWGFSATGSVIFLIPPTDTAVHVASGTKITIKIGSNATVGQQGQNWITNPAIIGTYAVSVGGTFGGSGSMLVAIGAQPQSSSSNVISFVQANSGGCSSCTSTTIPFTSNNAAGNLIVIGFAYSDAVSVVSVTDTKGNVYIRASEVHSVAGNQFDDIYYAKNISGGANSVTMNLSGSSSFLESYIHEYSGLDIVSPLDAASGNTNTGSGTIDSGPAATNFTNELIFGYGEGNTLTAGTGFTARLTYHNNLTEDKIVSAAGSYSASAGNSGGVWLMQMATFRAAGYVPAVTVQATVAESLAFTVAGSGISFVQENPGSCNPCSSTTVPFGSNNTAGNLSVVAINFVDTASLLSVTDTQGNVYVRASGIHNAAGSALAYIYYAKNIKGGANSVTVTLNSSVILEVIVHEYSGLDTVSPLDVTASSSGVSSSLDSGPATTNFANELIFGWGPNGGSGPTAGAGFTARSTSTGDITEDKVVSAIGTYDATATLNGGGNWEMQMATFKAAIQCTADDSATVNGINTTATAVPFGIIAPNTFYQGCQDLTVSTNAGNGYSVTVQESSAFQTADGRFTIPDTTCDAGDCTVATATTWVTPTNNGFGHTCKNQSGSDCNPTYGNGKKFKPVPQIPTGTSPSQISFVQGNAGTCSSCTPTTIPFMTNNTAGNLIVVAFDYANTVSLTSVTDTQGNVYVRAEPEMLQGGVFSDIFYAKNIKGGANSVTVTLSGSAFLEVFIHEYSGLDTVSPLDVTASSTGSGTNVDSGPATTNFANELIFGHSVMNQVTAPGSGFTARSTLNGDLTEDKIVSAIGTYDATASNLSGSWSMQLAAFRASNTPVSLMSNTGTVTNSTGRVKYRLSAGSGQPAGTYTTVITYTIYAAY
jgi:hypothetical protein